MQPADQPTSTSPPAVWRPFRAALVFAVVAFAWLRFSDNTVDNDLWGHVLYCQRYWTLGTVRCQETLSWTAAGYDVINHEYLAEIVTGLVHRVAGATGLWLYMMAMASGTVALAFRAGRGPGCTQKWTTLILLAASVNFIASGFAVRPQLFTTLALVVELILLRQVANGRLSWALLLPPLFAVWGNLHGGVLAGMLVLALMTGLESRRALRPRGVLAGENTNRPPRRVLFVYGLLAVASVGALLLNPWGVRLVRWNIDAVLLPRPQIAEWHAMSISAGHVPFFVVVVVSLLGWVFSRQPRRLWEAATLLLLAAMGMLHQRHAPLFGLANLVLSPRHLDDAARRIAPHCRSLIAGFHHRGVQAALAVALLAAGGAALVASVSPPRQHPFTMEVENDVYPVAAVEFMQARRLFGKTITFFDWGQQNLWELPFNPVSFDGRFDTGYPRAVIVAHWDFYQGRALRPEVDWAQAEVALLPTGSGGVDLLLHAGWRAVYLDPLATVLVPAHGRWASFRAGQPPVRRGADALRGRRPFPDTPALLATAAAPR